MLKGCHDLLNSFLEPTEMIMSFLSFILTHIFKFVYIESSLYSRAKSHLTMANDPYVQLNVAC